jgi:hypothetical protein
VSRLAASHQAAGALNCETVCTSPFDYSTVKNAREMETDFSIQIISETPIHTSTIIGIRGVSVPSMRSTRHN